MTNSSHSRVSDLETSGGNGNNEFTVAFSAHNVIMPITVESNVAFPELNISL